MQTLLVYYSYGGNTEKIAELLRQETGAKLLRLETLTPYPSDYNTVVDQGKQEVNSGFLPELKPLAADLRAYERILLGTPVWWYTFAPAMKAFLHQYDLAGKELWPFATNGGWIGHTFRDFKQACPGSAVKRGLNVLFDGNRLRTPEAEIRAWAKEVLS